MRLPTIPELIDRADCTVFGHQWARARTAIDGPIWECTNCGERRYRR